MPIQIMRITPPLKPPTTTILHHTPDTQDLLYYVKSGSRPVWASCLVHLWESMVYASLISIGQPFVEYWYAGSISTPVHVTAFIVQILVAPHSGLGVQGFGGL